MKINEKTRKNRCKIDANFEREKKGIKTWKNMDLGGSWAQFGRGLGRSGASFGRSWATFAHFFDVLNDVFFKHGSKMDSKTPFGSILGGSWKDLGRIWGGFGREF